MSNAGMMNERIRELALQAGEYVNSVYTPPVRSKTPGKIWEDGHVDWQEQFNQKFAELIVKECAELCLKHAEYYGLFQQMEFRKGQHFNTIIKNHFGVKE